jgi:hypothetical protein
VFPISTYYLAQNRKGFRACIKNTIVVDKIFLAFLKSLEVKFQFDEGKQIAMNHPGVNFRDIKPEGQDKKGRYGRKIFFLAGERYL